MSENSNTTVGKNALAVMQNQVIFKKPSGAPKKKKKQEVLEEDIYVEEIGKIIQRDFFPDLEKLKAQNDYLDAMEKNDTVRIRQLYAKYSGNRPPTERIPSPATFETPANIHNSQSTPSTSSNIDNDTENGLNTSREQKLSLDQFLNSHTSQDNESFEEILSESEKRHKLKYSYLYKEEGGSAAEMIKLALPTIEEQCALPEKKLNVDTWGYKNKNYIMFVPDGVSLTQEEQIELNKKRQEVVYSNTRLKSNPFNEMQNQETISELAKSQAKVLDGKIGVDGKELIKTGPAHLGGYSLLQSPSPSPGAMGSPLMTWGTIEGTPFRLDGSDTPLPKSQGPAFKMSEPPRREQIALALTEKVGEKNRDQKKKALDAQKRQFATPSPRSNRSTIDRLAAMSPAAKKLATSKLKLGVNSELLVSYSPSPSHRTKTPITPRRISTPKARKPIELSTDDLLKINLPKRQKASDFF